MSVITEMYREMGIRNSVVSLGKEIEATLKERFDTVLKEMRDDGTLSKLCLKYTKKDYTQGI